jgi:hypothetical protein
MRGYIKNKDPKASAQPQNSTSQSTANATQTSKAADHEHQSRPTTRSQGQQGKKDHDKGESSAVFFVIQKVVL